MPSEPTEHNKIIVRRYFEGDRDGRDNTAIWDEICDPHLVVLGAGLPEPVRGLDAVKQFTIGMHSAFSNFGLTVEDLIAEGGRVAARWTMRGTHTAPLALPGLSLPATGRQIAVGGMSFCRVADGKLVEELVQGDWMSMMVQLGAIPAPGQAA
jgi:predicted ester cyclase